MASASVTGQREFELIDRLTGPMGLAEVLDGTFRTKRVVRSSERLLTPMWKYEFTHWDQNRKTRRPQGTAVKGDHIINSWYFTGKSDDWEGDCKLTIMDRRRQRYVNVAPVQRTHDGTDRGYVRIQSHAGGLAMVGDFLFVADSSITALRIFDTRKIFSVADNRSSVISSQKFVLQYQLMMPEIGRIELSTPDNAGPSFVSLCTIGGVEHLVTGNFYSWWWQYDDGGKSMIWCLPITRGTARAGFPSVHPRLTIREILPRFPSGSEKGDVITRIQGVALQDGFMILSRSFKDWTKQLIVLKFDEDYRVQDPHLFFSGTRAARHAYEHENWLYGSQDLSLSEDGRALYTLTEFVDHRAVYGMRTRKSSVLPTPRGFASRMAGRAHAQATVPPPRARRATARSRVPVLAPVPVRADRRRASRGRDGPLTSRLLLRPAATPPGRDDRAPRSWWPGRCFRSSDHARPRWRTCSRPGR